METVIKVAAEEHQVVAEIQKRREKEKKRYFILITGAAIIIGLLGAWVIIGQLIAHDQAAQDRSDLVTCNNALVVFLVSNRVLAEDLNHCSVEIQDVVRTHR